MITIYAGRKGTGKTKGVKDYLEATRAKYKKVVIFDAHQEYAGEKCSAFEIEKIKNTSAQQIVVPAWQDIPNPSLFIRKAAELPSGTLAVIENFMYHRPLFIQGLCCDLLLVMHDLPQRFLAMNDVGYVRMYEGLQLTKLWDNNLLALAHLYLHGFTVQDSMRRMLAYPPMPHYSYLNIDLHKQHIYGITERERYIDACLYYATERTVANTTPAMPKLMNFFA